jgi:photosystem II stability/assembly factor-like uncharacterized protein
MRALLFLAALTATAPLGLAISAQAQWTIQTPTTADLRGIDNVGQGIAWASGTNGTVLRTEDAGYLWQRCTIPPGAEHLDFRGIQAFDANTAIVMSSGPGDQSRLYKTTDGCQTWHLIFTDPYGPEGFFDALLFLDRTHGIVFGDPTLQTPFMPSTEYRGNFRIRVTADGGATWAPISAPDIPTAGNGLHAAKGEAAFAASNSNIAFRDGHFWFATSFARVSSRTIPGSAPTDSKVGLFEPSICGGAVDPISGLCGQPWTDFFNATVPLQHASSSAGIFSLAFRTTHIGIAVGGDYLKPSDSTMTAALTTDGGKTWQPATNPPHGYRSAVAYDAPTKTWITVGPNGTDISTDDGRNWRALHPTGNEAPDADQHWNALSLPYAVGPHGRIGILNPSALQPSSKTP